MRIVAAGDSALLVQFEPVIHPDVNARVVALAAALRGMSVVGVREVVPAICSVAVHFDPLATDVGALTAAIEAAGANSPEPAVGRIVEIPVRYGGSDGPDLDAVAAFAGCTPAEVIERHSRRDYHVYMLGFLPGFPYMAAVDDSIAAPRHAVPRARVPAGSVGIAGRQTGIYPCDSPGGWQIVGRTARTLFDVSRTPPATFAAGDTVRFRPVEGMEPAEAVSAATVTAVEEHEPTASAVERTLTVKQPGLLTTIQDSGRWGHQAQGVAVSGAMDPAAHRLANTLVGNPRMAATIEVTIVGPELQFAQPTRLAISGADLRPAIDGMVIPRNHVVECAAGGVLRFGERRDGARAYIACDGGIDAPPVLGSRATHLRSGIGGYGRPLRMGDRLRLGPPVASKRPRGADHVAALTRRSRVSGGARLRVLPGPQAAAFDERALDDLQRGIFIVSPQSDRMGYRLTGPSLRAVLPGEMISDPVFLGAIQVPPSGHPILLMADRQTTGGYPQIAIVITADLPLAGQLAPGDAVRFDLCSRSDAIAALVADERAFLALE